MARLVPEGPGLPHAQASRLVKTFKRHDIERLKLAPYPLEPSADARDAFVKLGEALHEHVRRLAVPLRNGVDDVLAFRVQAVPLCPEPARLCLQFGESSPAISSVRLQSRLEHPRVLPNDANTIEHE